MKVLVIFGLIYLGYRLVIPKKEIHLEERKSEKISDEEYTDYEEIED